MMFKQRSIAAGVACALGLTAGLAGLPALAQDVRVEVTGTNIRRVDAETASPVQVITSQEMIDAGYTTIEDVLRDLPGNGQGLLSQGFNGAFGGGASGVALRGLNVGNTLVLVDGYRTAPYPLSDDGQKGFVNISSIPFAMVERVEVLLDGASAIYGSDAIGGVVNIILKKHFTGYTLTADGGATFQGDGGNYRVAFTSGFKDSSSKYGGIFSIEYRKQEGISFQDRDGESWANMNWAPEGGNDLRPGARSPIQLNPTLLTPYLQRPGGSTSDPANNIFLDSRCNLQARNANECVHPNTWGMIQSPTENLNVVGNFNARLDGNWEFNLSASYFNSTAEQNRRPLAVPVGSSGAILAYGPGQIPTLVNAIPVFTVPASYPGNTFGVPANVRAYIPDASNQRTKFDSDAYRVVGEFGGGWAGWDLKLAGGYTYVSTDLKYPGATSFDVLLDVLNDPANPFSLTGPNDPAVLSRVQPGASAKKTSELDFVQVTGTRDVMKLEGGPLGLALGASYVYQKLNADNAQGCKDGTLVGLSCFYAVGDQSVTAAYAEVLAPVLKSLELGAAIRYDYYDTYGGQWTPKVSAKWTPIPQAGMRATWGQGFRAPYIPENGDSGLAYTAGSYRDRELCPVSNANGSPNLQSPENVPAFCSFTPPYQGSANKDLDAEESTNWGVGLVLEPVRGWSVTADYYSIKLKNQILPASTFSNFDPADYTVRGPIQSVTYGDGRQGPSTVGPIAFIADRYINATSTKTTGLDFTTSYAFKLPDASQLRVGAVWNHIFKYDLTTEGVTYDLAGTHGPAILSGNTGNPQDRLQLSAQWTKGGFTGVLTGNYVSSYDMVDPASGYVTCDDMAAYGNPFRWSGATVPEQYCKVDSFWYWSLGLNYQVNPKLQVRLSVTNLFDKGAPIDMGGYAGNGENRNSSRGAPYNPSLHWDGVVGASWLLGLTYTF